MTTCRHCGARIRWVVTAKHAKPMPLDAEPTPEGNVILRADGAAVVLDIPDRDRAVERGAVVVYRTHFASCPNSQRRRHAGVR